jgi:ecotin
MKTLCALSFLAIFAAVASADDSQSHWEKAYPAAEQGMVRHVLHLKSLDDENKVKVELIVGKVVETDGVNHYFFTGAITEATVAGWGYPRYNVKVGGLGSTLMAPDPNKPKENKFIALGGEPFLVRYNSRLPIVVYVPEGFEVRYRIWKGDTETKSIDKG